MRRWVAGLGVILVVGVTPAVGRASVIVGSPLGDGFGGSIGRGAPTVFVQTSLPVSGAQLTSPVDGTVVHWRLRGTSANGSANTFRLRVLRPAGGGTFTGVGTSSSETTPNAFNDDLVRKFDTSLAIRAGDQVGLDADTGADVPKASVLGAGTEVFDGFADGSPSGTPIVVPLFQDTEMLFNAEVVTAPTTSATVPACSETGETIPVSMTTDPASAPKAVHFRLDGGAEQVSAAPSGTTTITVPAGRHTLEYWGEDQLPQEELQHHTVTVGCPSNAFSFAVKGNRLQVSVAAAGKVDVSDAMAPLSAATANKRRRLLLRPSSASGGPPTITVLLRPTKTAKSRLRRKGKVTVNARITFTPQGGIANTQRAKLKIRGKKK